MKYAVPTFSYFGFDAFSATYAERKFFSVNIGDYMQTLAIRNVYRLSGVSENNVIEIDRDRIASYRGEPAVMILNGCYYPSSFPLPRQIIPIFMGLCVDEDVVAAHGTYFKEHEPIGCRDGATYEAFRRHGVRAYVTGCLTMTFLPRSAQPSNPKTLLVYGGYAGAFPMEALRFAPQDLLETMEPVSQRKVVHSHPLTPRDQREAEGYASSLFEYYRDNASLVITSLHHAATPCLALGIPTIICRKHVDPRFSYLGNFAPVHVAPDFDGIDWEPRAVDLGEVRRNLLDRAAIEIERASEQHDRSTFARVGWGGRRSLGNRLRQVIARM